MKVQCISVDVVLGVSIEALQLDRNCQCPGSLPWHIRRCTFQNYTRTAVQLNNSSFHLSKSFFLQNSVHNLHGPIRYLPGNIVGASITVTWSIVTIRECTFEKNNGKYSGAIFVQLHSEVVISSSAFFKNSAT